MEGRERCSIKDKSRKQEVSHQPLRSEALNNSLVLCPWLEFHQSDLPDQAGGVLNMKQAGEGTVPGLPLVSSAPSGLTKAPAELQALWCQ